jgi:hypothetical protein
MSTFDRKSRNVAFIVLALMFSAALVACGGGGGGTTSSLSGGQVSASLSVASAPDYPAGTTFAVPTGSPVGTSAPPDTTPAFDHVWVTVTKIALIPSTGQEFPDRDGEIEMEDSAAEGGTSGIPGFVTFELPSPVVFDLLHPPTGRQVARLLNRFPDIPAGEYSKIRVYYSKVEGETSDNTFVPFHATAHYHFDVHFVGGNLVVPVTTDPSGGIRFYRIRIHVVGLKIHSAGNSGNVLLRPQVFATVDPAEYLVSGIAQNVNPADNTFDILTPGGTTVPAAYSATTDWVYIDNTVVPAAASSAAGDVLGAGGLQNGAGVGVIGSFSSDKTLLSEEVDVTFPDVLAGKVSVGWKGDNTFDLRIPAGDNTVFPMPARSTAYYDNVVDSTRLNDTNISDNASIIARGYKMTGGIAAYWISIGP